MSLGLRRPSVAWLLACLVAAVLVLAVFLPWGIGGEIARWQRVLHDHLVAALRAVKNHEAAAQWGLLGTSFLYGIFHAAGPGHGKAVIATYLAANERRLRRGLLLSAASSLVQGVTAVAITAVAVWLLERSLHQAQETVMVVEQVSFALIGLLGLVLAVGGGQRLWRRLSHQPGAHQDHHDHHGDHCHGHHAGCGHVHGSGSEDAVNEGWLPSLAVIAAVGIRPCSGAILVLLFAHAVDLAWAGIASVAAMTVGTAITVSALACLAVYARRWSLALLTARSLGKGRAAVLVDGVRLAGGLAVALIGFSLLAGALATLQQPPF